MERRGDRWLDRTRPERDTYHALYLEMMETNRKLERGLMGQASERLHRDNGAQLSFDMLSSLIADREKAAIDTLVERASEQTVREHTRQKPTGGATEEVIAKLAADPFRAVTLDRG